MPASELPAFDRARLAVPAPDAAVELLGARLVRELPEGRIVVRIVETEAYDATDPASHSYRGRTPRTEAMFGIAGTSYVYRSYGVHWCCNVTVDVVGHGAAVLLRAAAIEEGHALVRTHRGLRVRDRDLLRGPGRLTSGLALDGPRHDGVDLIDGAAGIRLAAPSAAPGSRSVHRGPRVGVSQAADVPWRFHLDDPEVSPYRRSPRARP